MNRARALAAALALWLAACGGGGGGDASPGTATRPGVLSISELPALLPAPVDAQDFANRVAAAKQRTYDAGTRGRMDTWTWRVLEPTAGRFDTAKLAEMDAALADAQARGLVQFVGLQVINTSATQMPAGLEGLAFDSATLQTRFKALLDRVLVPNRGRIRYLSIGNEVDVWLRAHPAEWPRYRSFFNAMAQYARTLDPAVQVGVTLTADGALVDSAAEARDLLAGADIVVLNYYPLRFDAAGNVRVRDIANVPADFDAMRALAGSKPLVLQEVGYPAATSTGGSAASQAAFVSRVFAAWKAAPGRVPFLNFFLLHDFTPAMCTEFSSYYGITGSVSFYDYLCSLGFFEANGTPRAAWATLQAEARAAGLP